VTRPPRQQASEDEAAAFGDGCRAGGDHAPTILVVEGDGSLAYLLARYAKQAGLAFRQMPTRPLPGPVAAEGPTTLWLPSIERLEAVRPRETGLLSDDSPVIVCSYVGEESRAHSLGADYCVTHPLTYPDFLVALRAVGFATYSDGPPRALNADPDRDESPFRMAHDLEPRAE
jgi:hypothetical protein